MRKPTEDETKQVMFELVEWLLSHSNIPAAATAISALAAAFEKAREDPTLLGLTKEEVDAMDRLQ